jgi:hypothetical protein
VTISHHIWDEMRWNEITGPTHTLSYLIFAQCATTIPSHRSVTTATTIFEYEMRWMKSRKRRAKQAEQSTAEQSRAECGTKNMQKRNGKGRASSTARWYDEKRKEQNTTEQNTTEQSTKNTRYADHVHIPTDDNNRTTWWMRMRMRMRMRIRMRRM